MSLGSNLTQVFSSKAIVNRLCGYTYVLVLEIILGNKQQIYILKKWFRILGVKKETHSLSLLRCKLGTIFHNSFQDYKWQNVSFQLYIFALFTYVLRMELSNLFRVERLLLYYLQGNLTKPLR